MDAISRPQVQWLQVCSLALVQGAISLAWVIYNLYLAQLLTQLGFPESWARGLLIIENGLAIGMEPLMGGLSDQQQRWLGTRFPFISLGVILASALFIAMPAVVLWGSSIAGIGPIFLVITIAWALAMTMFRSPAIVLLNNYAFATQLPQAFSILTLAGGLIGAIRPLATQQILSLGPALTFAIGSLVLLGAVGVLRAVHSPISPPLEQPEPSPEFQAQIIPRLAILFAVGFAVAWGLRLTMGEILPRVIKAELTMFPTNLLLGLLSIALALFALLAGIIASRQGNRLTMIVGAGLTASGLTLLSFVHGAVWSSLIIVATIAALSSVLNGTIPLALELAPVRWGGLAIGMYFGGFSAAMSGFSYLFAKPALLTSPQAILMSVVAFLLAGAGVAVTHGFKPLTIQPTSA